MQVGNCQIIAPSPITCVFLAINKGVKAKITIHMLFYFNSQKSRVGLERGQGLLGLLIWYDFYSMTVNCFCNAARNSRMILLLPVLSSLWV